jgi:glycosyltransferase involved in cell wall biosynthesis
MSRRVATRLVSFGDEERCWRDGCLPIRILPRTHYVRGDRFNPISLAIAGELLQADIVHLHQQHILTSSLSAMFGRVAGKTVVVTDHGGGGCDFSWYLPTDALFHKHLSVSAFSHRGVKRGDSHNAHVILGGVDPHRFFPPAPLVPRGPRALFVGRVLPHKGVHDLIEALPSMLGLDIVGPEPDADYGASLRAIALGRDVAFLGSVSDRELVERYGRALCVVLPSVHHNRFGVSTTVPELLGQTLLEAMACGTPAVATSVGGMPETIIDGVTGFVVPPGDPRALRACLERLAGDDALVENMGRAAASHVRTHFTWDRVVDRCLKVYGHG